MTPLETAVSLYHARKARRAHPEGKFDKAGRFYPAETEERECCQGIRTPSRAFPYSYMTHCRTAAHVAALYGVDAAELRRAARA